ncbi:MAG TPA: metal-sulfur cluster assembly factor [Solirubrobacteraceae bacterium]|jgi:metal-sulfur cluster biosynthetic enzyme|nr:metal-sulfur cluster assembly factor [Solirubrobacteraceae bacterium]
MDGQNVAHALTEERVLEALEDVIDPELGLDFVTLGLIYGVEIRDGDVEVVFSLTTPGCPIGPQAAAEIVELVGALDGVGNVTPRLVFDPPWTKERLSEDARFALGI